MKTIRRGFRSTFDGHCCLQFPSSHFGNFEEPGVESSIGCFLQSNEDFPHLLKMAWKQHSLFPYFSGLFVRILISRGKAMSRNGFWYKKGLDLKRANKSAFQGEADEKDSSKIRPYLCKYSKKHLKRKSFDPFCRKGWNSNLFCKRLCYFEASHHSSYYLQ